MDTIAYWIDEVAKQLESISNPMITPDMNPLVAHILQSNHAKLYTRLMEHKNEILQSKIDSDNFKSKCDTESNWISTTLNDLRIKIQISADNFEVQHNQNKTFLLTIDSHILDIDKLLEHGRELRLASNLNRINKDIARNIKTLTMQNQTLKTELDNWHVYVE